MLVEKESEKLKWVDALNELHRILRRNKLSSKTVSFQDKIKLFKRILPVKLFKNDYWIWPTMKYLLKMFVFCCRYFKQKKYWIIL